MQKNHFDKELLHCVFDRVTYPSFTKFATIFRFFLPGFILIFFYSRIFHKTYEARARVLKNEKKKIEKLKKSLKFSKGIFCSVLFYLISILPSKNIILIKLEIFINRLFIFL